MARLTTRRDVVQRYSGVRLITQANAGPAAAAIAARSEAQGTIILFTDDDCVPMPDWLDAMLEPFEDPEVVGAKGVYRTRQTSLGCSFRADRIRGPLSSDGASPRIDFIDTYSAAFRRDRFLEMTVTTPRFPLACAEDIELSYRMSARGWKMKFAPAAIVYHTHPDTSPRYLKKKYKFAFWRVLAVRKNPSKAVKDSHTPQLMKLQLLFVPALLLAFAFDLTLRPTFPASLLVLTSFLVSTLPFTLRAIKKDAIVGFLSPALLAARAWAQVAGSRGWTVLCPPQVCPGPDQVGGVKRFARTVAFVNISFDIKCLRIANRRSVLLGLLFLFVNTIRVRKGRIRQGDVEEHGRPNLWGRMDVRVNLPLVEAGCTLRENLATIFPKILQDTSFVSVTTNASGRFRNQ